MARLLNDWDDLRGSQEWLPDIYLLSQASMFQAANALAHLIISPIIRLSLAKYLAKVLLNSPRSFHGTTKLLYHSEMTISAADVEFHLIG